MKITRERIRSLVSQLETSHIKVETIIETAVREVGGEIEEPFPEDKVEHLSVWEWVEGRIFLLEHACESAFSGAWTSDASLAASFRELSRKEIITKLKERNAKYVGPFIYREGLPK